MGSISLLNKAGHITIAWTDENDQEVAAAIQRKMDQGVRFFQRKPFGDEEIQIQNLAEITGREVLVHDDDFATLITDGKASILSRTAYAAGQAIGGFTAALGRRITDASEAARTDTYAVRQFAGG